MAVQEINSADKLLNIFRREIWRKKNTIFVPFLTSLVLLNKVEILNGISVLQESGPSGLANILKDGNYPYCYFLGWYFFLPLLSAFFIQIFFVIFKIGLSTIDFKLDKLSFRLGVENILDIKLKSENRKLERSLSDAQEELEKLRNRGEAFDGFSFDNLRNWSGKPRDFIKYAYVKALANKGIESGYVRWKFGRTVGILESPFDSENPDLTLSEVEYDLIGSFATKDSGLIIIRYKRITESFFVMILRKINSDTNYFGVEYEFEKLGEKEQMLIFSNSPNEVLNKSEFTEEFKV